MDVNEITKEIINAAIQVHRKFGPGMLESSYHACLEFELKERGFNVRSQVPLPLIYKGVKLEIGYRIDLIVNEKVIIEVKSVEVLNEVHKAQILTYLKLTGTEIGLLINFNVCLLKNGIKRFINTPHVS